MTSKEKTDGLLGCLTIISYPIAVFVKAYVGVKLWSWFITPFGIGEVSLAHMFGLSLLVGLMYQHSSSSSVKEEKEMSTVFLEYLGRVFIAPLTVLLFGYITHQYM